jgi:hypothetical protein
MKRYAFLYGVLIVLFVFTGCSQDNTALPAQSTVTSEPAGFTADPAAIAAEIIARADWKTDPDAGFDSGDGGPMLTSGGGYVTWYDREVIAGDVVHYSFEIQVGSGQYDVIGLHRVVREIRPNVPIRARKSIFLQHGDLIGFSKFLFGAYSPGTPDDHAVAVYLAQNNVDVWGIDQNWTRIPQETSDHSFMATWDLQNQVNNLSIGLSVARISRLATGNGWRKMNLLGYSSGTWTAYALLNQETQLPPGHRQVAGFIPVDGGFKVDESDRPEACATAQGYQDLLNAGVYGDGTAWLWGTAALLARVDPDGASPILPGFTNLQTALVAGAATYLVAGIDCCYHFVAGEFNEYGVPTGLQFTPVEGFLDFLGLGGGYMPYLWHYENEVLSCDEIDLPYDDHIGEITVPILYVGSGGGYAESGLYTVGLLGSSDVSSMIVRLYPPEAAAIEFGHTDLWSATNAPGLVWQPILDWIEDHTPGRGDVAIGHKN